MQLEKVPLLKSPVAVAVAVALSQLKTHLKGEALENLTTVNNSVQINLHRQINTSATSLTQIIQDDEVSQALEDVLKKGGSLPNERFNLRLILSEHLNSSSKCNLMKVV